MGKQKITPNYRRRSLRLPDLDHCKRVVLNSLGSPASRRVYEFANRPVHRLVLLRTSAGVQPHRGPALSHVPWNRGIWPPTPSTSNWQRCAAWLTKPPTQVC